MAAGGFDAGASFRSGFNNAFLGIDRKRKDAAYNALRAAYGDIAGDPEAAASLQQTEQRKQLFPGALQEQGLANTRSQQVIDQSQVKAQEDEAAQRRASSLRGALVVKQAIAGGADPGAAFDQVAPLLGIPPDEAAKIRAGLVANPQAIDGIIKALSDQQAAAASGPRYQIAQGADGKLYRVPVTGEGETNVVTEPGTGKPVVAYQAAQGAERLNQGQQRIDLAAPGGQQGVAAAREVGKAQGKADAQSIHGVQDIAKARATLSNNELRFSAAKTNIAEARKYSKDAGIFAPLAQYVPNTSAANFNAALNSVHADIVNNVIQGYKDSTPQGQASGVGRIMASEIQLWQDAFAAVQVSQSPAARESGLKRLNDVTDKLRETSKSYFSEVYGVTPEEAAPRSDEDLLKQYGPK